MGCEVQKAYDGREIDVHRFDDKQNADAYLLNARGYRFERHEPWGCTAGIDFYAGPTPNLRASLREQRGTWTVYFWNTDPVTAAPARHFRIRPCNGNKSCWTLVAIRDNGREGDSYGSYVTGASLDSLMKAAAYFKLTAADRIEFVPMESAHA